MHHRIMHVTFNIETQYKPCVSIEDINRGAKKMSNGNAMDANLMKL